MKLAVAYLTRRHDPLTSLVLTVPVFLAYHLGIVLIEHRNGVDLVTTLTLELLDHSLPGYVGLTLLYAVLLAVAAHLLQRRGKVRPAALLPVLLESTCWAVLMLVLVGWAIEDWFGASFVAAWQTGTAPRGVLDKLVLSAGAGFHEEAVFRVVLFAGGSTLLRRWTRLTNRGAWLLSAVVSALAFSAMHHVGSAADPFALAPFAFRTLAGLFLSAVYWLRGFAVVVYTHTVYDVMVFFVLP